MWNPLSFFRRDPEPRPVDPGPVIPSSQAALDIPPDGTTAKAEILRYPPFDTGFRCLSVRSVIKGQEDIIARINRTAGLSEAEFGERFEPTIHRLASYVHLLPATSTTFFRGEGGLLRMSLEIGLFSLQTANSSVFPIAGGVERRYYIQPKWCVAAFLAGACSQLHRAINHMAVVSGDGQQWAALMRPLSEWADSGGYSTYFVRWLDEPHGNIGQAAGAFLVNQIVSPTVLQWLAEGNNHVLPAMASAIAGIDSTHRDNPIARIVAPIVTRVIADDMRRNSLNYGHLSVGLHLEPHIIDAMRRLVAEGQWVPNHPRSPLWVGSDGTYLRWSAAAADIVAFLNRDGFAGVPQDPDVLADLLIRSAVLQRKDSHTFYWTIVLPNSGDLVEGAAKFSQHDFIFAAGWTAPDGANTVLAISDRALAAKAARNSAPSGGSTPTTDGATSSSAQAQIELELAGPPVVASTPHSNAELVPQQTAKPAAARAPRPRKAKEAPKAEASEKERSATDIESVESEAPSAAPPEPPVPPTIPTAPKVKSPDPAMLGTLKKEHAWLLTEIVTAYQEGRLVGVIHFMPTGVGISTEELNAHGQQIQGFLAELDAKRWLWKDHNNNARLMHRISVGDQEFRMMVLRPDVASNLGFIEQEAA
jgi:conjugal transfer pilus assembly protein TraI